MLIRVPGPIDIVDAEDRSKSVGGLAQERLLALLAAAGTPGLSAEAIVDELWRGDPPADPAATLGTYVSRLRRVLGTDGATVASAIYALTDRETDVDRFEA